MMKAKSLAVGIAVAFLATILVVVPSTVLAADKKTDDKKTDTSTQDLSPQVTSSYTAGPEVQIGMMVKLKDKDNTTVVPFTDKDGSKLLGVVVTPEASAITLTPDEIKAQQVFVAKRGRYQVFVSNQNGVIKAGDFIAISSIAGVGMLAGEQQEVIIGHAVSEFNGTANVVSSVKLKDKFGKETTVAIGKVLIDLDVSHNPFNQKSSDFLPAFLINAAASVSGKPVSVARIYMGVVILIISGFVTANLVYSGVRNGMKAIGRNPLSKKSIMKSLIQTVIAALIVFFVGVFAVYLLLKL